MTRIGVLALQGDFREHIRALERLGASAHPVRLPRDLEGVDGLIFPGGESTVMGKLMVSVRPDTAVTDPHRRGHTRLGHLRRDDSALARDRQRARSGSRCSPR